MVTEIISTDVVDGDKVNNPGIEGEKVTETGESVPPLPEKRSPKHVVMRTGSLYDNVPEEGKDSESPVIQNVDSDVAAIVQEVSDPSAAAQQSSVVQQSIVQTSMQAYRCVIIHMISEFTVL